MDTKSFVKILRKVVREEVRTALKDMINESSVTDNQVINKGVNLHDLVDNQSTVKKKFAKNSMLNDILNETAETADFGAMNDYPTMGEMMTSNTVQEPLEGIDGESIDTSKPEIQAINKAINRDYSGLMKAINKKNGRMGVS